MSVSVEIDYRCEHCGRLKSDSAEVLYCAPPFKVQRHAFTGKHPADMTKLSDRVQAAIQARRTLLALLAASVGINIVLTIMVFWLASILRARGL